MVAITFSIGMLPTLAKAVRLYPEGTPNRWSKVQAFGNDCINKDCQLLQTPTCEVGTGVRKFFDRFEIGHWRLVAEGLGNQLNKHYIYQIKDTKVLIPAAKTCCDRECLIGRDRPARITLYTNCGATAVDGYFRKCLTCKSRYYWNFEDNDDSRKYRNTREGIFQTSHVTAFSEDFIEHLLIDIQFGNSFEQIAEKYNALHVQGNVNAIRNKLEDIRAEECWYLINILRHAEKADIKRTVVGERLDIETACKKFMTESFGKPSEFSQHQCETLGCKLGFVMVDGNEKIHRRLCAAPTDKLRLSRSMPTTISACPNGPVLGGKSAAPSRFCCEHSYLEKELQTQQAKHSKIIIEINLKDEHVSTKVIDMIKDVPPNNDDTVMVGCKKAKNRNIFHNRTAGIMAIVKPCGIIIDHREMYTCESSSQLFCQLLLLLDSLPCIKYVGYDRACEFHPFLVNLAKKGNAGAEQLLKLGYLVDRFHIKGHTTQACDISSDQCMYHPDLPKFAQLVGVNTSCAEQSFSWLRKFKNSVKYMSPYKYKFFLNEVICQRNARLSSNLPGCTP